MFFFLRTAQWYLSLTVLFFDLVHGGKEDRGDSYGRIPLWKLVGLILIGIKYTLHDDHREPGCRPPQTDSLISCLVLPDPYREGLRKSQQNVQSRRLIGLLYKLISPWQWRWEVSCGWDLQWTDCGMLVLVLVYLSPCGTAYFESLGVGSRPALLRTGECWDATAHTCLFAMHRWN